MGQKRFKVGGGAKTLIISKLWIVLLSAPYELFSSGAERFIFKFIKFQLNNILHKIQKAA